MTEGGSGAAARATTVTRRSGRDAPEQGGSQEDRALIDRRVGQSNQGGLDGSPLVVAQLVLGEDRVRRPLQIGEEVGIDHRAADQVGQTLGHGHGMIPEGDP